jgi:hypothetical protein
MCADWLFIEHATGWLVAREQESTLSAAPSHKPLNASCALDVRIEYPAEYATLMSMLFSGKTVVAAQQSSLFQRTMMETGMA